MKSVKQVVKAEYARVFRVHNILADKGIENIKKHLAERV